MRKKSRAFLVCVPFFVCLVLCSACMMMLVDESPSLHNVTSWIIASLCWLSCNHQPLYSSPILSLLSASAQPCVTFSSLTHCLYGILSVFHFFYPFYFIIYFIYLFLFTTSLSFDYISEQYIKLIITFSQLNSSPVLTVSFTCVSVHFYPTIPSSCVELLNIIWQSLELLNTLWCISNHNMGILISGGVSTSRVCVSDDFSKFLNYPAEVEFLRSMTYQSKPNHVFCSIPQLRTVCAHLPQWVQLKQIHVIYCRCSLVYLPPKGVLFLVASLLFFTVVRTLVLALPGLVFNKT